MRHFVLYCLCGGIGVTTDYAIFYVALSGGVWYQYANGLGYMAGTLVSFVLNRVFTFGVRDRVWQRLVLFVGVAVTGFAASALLLWLLVNLAGVRADVAKLLTLPLVVALQFGLNRRITFRTAAPL